MVNLNFYHTLENLSLEKCKVHISVSWDYIFNKCNKKSHCLCKKLAIGAKSNEQLHLNMVDSIVCLLLAKLKTGTCT